MRYCIYELLGQCLAHVIAQQMLIHKELKKNPYLRICMLENQGENSL